MQKMIGTGLVVAAIFGTSAHGQTEGTPCQESIFELAGVTISQTETLIAQRQAMDESDDWFLEAKDLIETINNERMQSGNREPIYLLETQRDLIEAIRLLYDSAVMRRRVVVAYGDMVIERNQVIQDKIMKNCF